MSVWWGGEGNHVAGSPFTIKVGGVGEPKGAKPSGGGGGNFLDSLDNFLE